MKKTKFRLMSDMKHARTAYLHDDALKAYDRLGKLLRESYKRPRWTVINIAIQLLDKVVKERGLKAGDNIEAELGIQG